MVSADGGDVLVALTCSDEDERLVTLYHQTRRNRVGVHYVVRNIRLDTAYCCEFVAALQQVDTT